MTHSHDATANDDLLRMPDFALDPNLFAEKPNAPVENDNLHLSILTRRIVEAAEGEEIEAVALGQGPMLVLIPGQDEQGRNMLHLDSTGFTASDIHQLLAAALDAVCATVSSGSIDANSLDLTAEHGFIVPMNGHGHGH